MKIKRKKKGRVFLLFLKRKADGSIWLFPQDFGFLPFKLDVQVFCSVWNSSKSLAKSNRSLKVRDLCSLHFRNLGNPILADFILFSNLSPSLINKVLSCKSLSKGNKKVPCSK